MVQENGRLSPETQTPVPTNMPKKKTASEQNDAERYLAALRDDFLFFADELWEDRGLDAVAPLSDLELDILAWIASGPYHAVQRHDTERPAIAENHPRRGIIGFRGVGKTYMIACYVCWLLYRDREHKIKIVSKTRPHAIATVGLIRDWIGAVWFLDPLTPHKDQIDAAMQFEVAGSRESRTPSVAADGIGGQITGSRAHTVIADDVETPHNTATVEAREKLATDINEFEAVLYPGGEIIYVGTYHNVESLYLKLVPRGYTFRSFPLVYPAPSDQLLQLSPMLERRLQLGLARPGDITAPHRFDQEHVQRQQAVGRMYFDMQFRLLSNLASSSLYPLRLSDLIVFDIDPRQGPVSLTWGTQNAAGSTAHPDLPCMGLTGDRLYRPIAVDADVRPYLTTKAFIDPAGRGRDETALAIASSLGGLIYVHAVIGIAGGITEPNLDFIAGACRDYNVRELVYESNIDVFGTFGQTLGVAIRRHFLEPNISEQHPAGWKCSISSMHSHSQSNKATRIIDTLEPVMSTHRLVMHPRALRPTMPGGDPRSEPDHELQRQLAFLTREGGSLRFDDRVDALHGVVKLFKDTVAQDPTKAADRHRRRSIQEIIAGDLADNQRPHEGCWLAERHPISQHPAFKPRVDPIKPRRPNQRPPTPGRDKAT